VHQSSSGSPATPGPARPPPLAHRLGFRSSLLNMSSTTASQEELKAHKVPLAWRDQCSAYVFFSSTCVGSGSDSSRLRHVTSCCVTSDPLLFSTHDSLLLPLNVCRKEKYYLPWECENERHAYEKCVSSSWFTVYSFLDIAILDVIDVNMTSMSSSTFDSPYI
jgi:NADH-ubiquinone oxidoreductase B18 subunit (NDUFB7)